MDRQFVPLGQVRIVSAGKDLTIVAWGNTVSLCGRVVAALSSVNKRAELIDLRSISPWDAATVSCSVERPAGCWWSMRTT